MAVCYVQAKDTELPKESFKSLVKGAIIKNRSRAFTIDDFLNMGNGRLPPELEKNMPKLQSKHWKMYFTMLGRYRPTILDRKRYLIDLDSSISVPHGFLADDC